MNQILTKASDIALLLTQLMETITVDNGYNTNIGLRVYRGKKKIEDENVPCGVIIEGEDHPGENDTRMEIQVSQDYVLGGYVVCEPDHPNDAAHLILKDIKRVIFKDGPRLGNRVKSVRYEGRDIGPRADGVAIVFAIIHITVSYAETLSNP